MVCKLKTVYTPLEATKEKFPLGLVALYELAIAKYVFVILGFVLVHLYQFSTCSCAEMGHAVLYLYSTPRK